MKSLDEGLFKSETLPVLVRVNKEGQNFKKFNLCFELQGSLAHQTLQMKSQPKDTLVSRAPIRGQFDSNPTINFSIIECKLSE